MAHSALMERRIFNQANSICCGKRLPVFEAGPITGWFDEARPQRDTQKRSNSERFAEAYWFFCSLLTTQGWKWLLILFYEVWVISKVVKLCKCFGKMNPLTFSMCQVLVMNPCTHKSMKHIHIQYMWPWTTKAVVSCTCIFVAIAKNGSELSIFLLCQKSLGYYVKIMFHEHI